MPPAMAKARWRSWEKEAVGEKERKESRLRNVATALFYIHEKIHFNQLVSHFGPE